MVLGPLDVVHDDEEIPFKFHFDDDVQLIIESLLQCIGNLRIAFCKSLVGDVTEVIGGVGELGRDFEFR